MTPDPNSAIIMSRIDRMSPDLRALVHEYGFRIVADLIDDGYRDALSMRSVLDGWRMRRQSEWLATNYIVRWKT